MNKPLSYLLLPLALLAAGALSAEERRTSIVRFDQNTPEPTQLHFIEDVTSLKPNLSVFTIENQRFLSGDQGERYALVTFRNPRNSVSVEEKDVVGVLANGKRLYPVRIEGESRIHELGTVLLHFGEQRFPLVKVETRN